MWHRMFPLRRRCISIFIFICLVYMVFFVIYSHSPRKFPSLTSIISQSYDSPEQLTEKLSLEFENLDISKDPNRFWKYSTKLHDYKLLVDPSSYERIRGSSHYYDPRITYAVYIHHINKKLQADSHAEVHIPFSWQDWVDLSFLNQFLAMDEGDKPSCIDILSHGLKYTPKLKGKLPRRTKVKKKYNMFASQPCVDDAKYRGPVPKKLLPGFNMEGQTVKSFFMEKKLYAKSYVLSSLPIPNSLVFLSENGAFEVTPDQEATMFDSGIYEEYVDDYLMENDLKSKSYLFKKAQKVLFDPADEFDDLLDFSLMKRDGPDFNQLLNKDTNYQYNIPFKDFYYNYPDIVDDLRSRKDQLTSKEKRHLESLEYSISQPERSLKKGFKEVNIFWPETYNGHKVKENGGHYDWRFFNGFLTESNINKYDDVDEKRKLILHRMLHTWLQFTFRTGIVSILAHGSLLSWWWDGLVFDWDNDIDVQMPIMELDKFCAAYNNSMIMEDVRFGFHKYYVDCSKYLTHRGNANGQNNIDARFVDVDSGMYIDITGLAISGSGKMPKRFHELWKSLREHPEKFKDPGFKFPGQVWENRHGKINQEHVSGRDDTAKIDYEAFSGEDNDTSLGKRGGSSHEVAQRIRAKAERLARNHLKNPDLEIDLYFDRNSMLQLVNCRNDHFYSWKEISPLKLSSMEGAPVFIPNQYENMLTIEYRYGLKRRTYKKYIYVDTLRFWMSMSKVRRILKSEAHSNSQTQVIRFLYRHKLRAMSKLLQDDNTMKEFYLTHKQTGDHVEARKLRNKHVMNKDNSSDRKMMERIEESFKEYNVPLRKDYHNYIAEVRELGEHRLINLDEVVDNELHPEMD